MVDDRSVAVYLQRRSTPTNSVAMDGLQSSIREISPWTTLPSRGWRTVRRARTATPRFASFDSVFSDNGALALSSYRGVDVIVQNTEIAVLDKRGSGFWP